MNSTAERHTSRKSLFLVIGIAAVALIAGIFAAILFTSEDEQGTAQGLSQQEAEQLSALQDSLVTSLAFPADYRSIPTFELTDANGNTITDAALTGQWSIAFFGYTHCPDVCPITLQVMKNVVAKMEEQQQTPPQIVFVSVDPLRDKVADMKQYLGYFNDSFVGITGDPDKIKELSASLGIVAVFTANDDDPENYIVDHTASLLLIDPEGRIRAKITPPHEVDKIIADFVTISSEPG